ncbi:MAG TPA: hypothetical protein VIV11_12365 [Kofleriaceae bacterium]
MPPALRLPIGLALCAAACATSPSHAGSPATPEQTASLDAPSAELAELLARYDREPSGPAKTKLAAEVDAFAHQKYATVSRLYWYTDLTAAQASARSSQRPILHLRMLGRLDEELSCANSRMFRATLYANREVSKFLRDNFVLYWSSERPVPKVTIDYGDGRKIERTTTGNSAHYVMDADGHVLDVLPGLYAPTAFRTELTDSLALARSVRGKSDDERAKLVIDYHQAELEAATEAGAKLIGTPYIPGINTLLTQRRAQAELAIAQRATMTKSAMEISDLRTITAEIVLEKWSEDDIALWASAGQMLYAIGDLERDERMGLPRVRGSGSMVRRAVRREDPDQQLPPRVLDDASLALVSRLHDAVAAVRTTKEQKDVMIRRLEQNLVADSALNQLRLRPAISREIMGQGGNVPFAKLNAFVYAEVFRTPKADAWLGLLPRTDFTGLPGDGVVMR